MTARRRMPAHARWPLLVAGMLAAALVHAQGATPPARQVELRVSVAVGPAYPLGKAADRWAKRITELGGGALTARLFPGATLAGRDPALEFISLRNGSAALAVGSSLYWSAEVAPLGAVGLPWLAPDSRQLAALAAPPFSDRLAEALDRAGVVPLAFAPLGHRQLAFRGRTLQAPGDFAGLRVRIGAPPLAELYAALGATPMTLTFAEAQVALSAGTLDAQESPVAMLNTARVDAAGLDRLLLWDAIGEIAVFAANLERFSALTRNERALVRSTAQEVAATLAREAVQDDEAALTALRKRGVVAARLSAAQRAAFVAATRGVYAKWAGVAGNDLTRAAEAAVAAIGP